MTHTRLLTFFQSFEETESSCVRIPSCLHSMLNLISCNHFTRSYHMTQLSIKNLHGWLWRNSQVMHSDISSSFGQTRIILYCMELLISIKAESGHMRTYMPIRKSRYIHHALLLGVASLLPWFWVQFISKSTVQKQYGSYDQLWEDVTWERYRRKSHLGYWNLIFYAQHLPCKKPWNKKSLLLQFLTSIFWEEWLIRLNSKNARRPSLTGLDTGWFLIVVIRKVLCAAHEFAFIHLDILHLPVSGPLTRFLLCGSWHIEHLLLWVCKYLPANKRKYQWNFVIWVLKRHLLTKRPTKEIFFIPPLKKDNNFGANGSQVNQFLPFLWMFGMLTHLMDTSNFLILQYI